MWEIINKFIQSYVIISACILSIIFSPVLVVINILTANMLPSGKLSIFTIVKLMLSFYLAHAENASIYHQ